MGLPNDPLQEQPFILCFEKIVRVFLFLLLVGVIKAMAGSTGMS
jgi:hypothetical protein